MNQRICKAVPTRLVMLALFLSAALSGCEGVYTSSGGASTTGVTASFDGGGTVGGGSQGGSIAITVQRGSGR